MKSKAEALEMFAVGAIVGAGLMYLMDPKVGRARRNYLRDELVHGINTSRRQTSRFIRDKRNRARGVLAQTFKNQEWFRHAGETANSAVDHVKERVGA